ncbi:MAG: class I mannose-6-phosphate isomerase [bacterium]|nr:class I mannose-6-phosphate isomerase [bacterium]
MKLYPLKFNTIYKDKIWGGQKIKNVLGKDFAPLPNCGETWEVSGVEGNISVVSQGPLQQKDLKSLIQEYKGELVGERVYKKFQDDFPLLIKFIDANDDLSIQVHPDDNLAKARHNSFGKTEMWYVMQADEGSSLISGFNKTLTKEEYLEAFNAGKLTSILNREDVSTDDVFFLPAGRVHTIGKGLMIAEIQQTSDITYRIYDFDRKDAEGNTRELHVEEALDAIDYNCYPEYKTKYSDESNQAVQLVKSDYFETNKIVLNSELERDFANLDSFVIYICLEGSGEITFEGGITNISMGDSILVPASIKNYKLSASPSLKLLETYVP